MLTIEMLEYIYFSHSLLVILKKAHLFRNSQQILSLKWHMELKYQKLFSRPDP